MRSFALAAALVVLLLVPGPPTAGTDTWPGFRGAEVDGVAAADLPADEGLTLEVAWRRPLGSGYSGVAVADGRAVTMFSDGTSDLVVALDAGTGEERWRYTLGPTYTGHDGSHTGPLSTPRIAAGHVFALAPRGRLVALDVANGREVWATDLVAEHQATKPHYGFATSPLLVGGVLVVEIGGKEAAVAGFDPRTGKRLWTAGGDTVDYQSPVVATVAGVRQVVATTNKKLIGLDPSTGAVLWEQEHGGSGARGLASLVPVPAGAGRLFLEHKDDSSALVRLDRQADGTIAMTTAWEDPSIRNSYNVPVYRDGHLYAFSSRVLTCVDAESGKAVWRSREPGDGFLILVGGHLLVATKQGGVHVVEASPSGYRELASLPVFDDLAWTPPSFAGGALYARSLSEIARIDVRPGGGTARTLEREVPPAGAPRFERFLSAAVVAAPSERAALVDRFLASIDSFPLVEAPDRVTFLYRGPGTDLALAGDMIGARQEVPMTRLDGTDLFYHALQLDPDARVNYAFFRDFETIIDPRNPRKTQTTLLGPEMELSFNGAAMDLSWVAMPGWTAPAHLADPDPASRGRVEAHELDSAALGRKHAFEVYLPVGYDGGDRRYPVAYVHGGAAAKQEGQVLNTLDNAIGKSVAPLIVVLIQAPPRGPTYGKMLTEELVPFMDSTYRTLAVPGSRASVGAGFLAVPAIQWALQNPTLVGGFATQSAVLLESMLAAIDPLVRSAAEQPLSIYMDWGKYDLRNPHENWDMGTANRRFAELLQSKGYRVAGGEVHDGTGWSSWRNRTDAVFAALFPVGG